MANVKLFIDFWNFQLAWNSAYNPRGAAAQGQQLIKIAWKDVPTVLIAELPAILGATIPMIYKGTRLYASVNPTPGGKDQGLKNFLHNTLGQMTGYQVMVHDRRPKTDTCGNCGNAVHRHVEKGVDTSIVSELFEGAINNAYDVAILVSNDSDFVPAIKTIQDRLNKQIIHAGFRTGGGAVRTACWGHILFDGPVGTKIRDPAT
jgi:hypothetical protein